MKNRHATRPGEALRTETSVSEESGVDTYAFVVLDMIQNVTESYHIISTFVLIIT